MSAIAPLRTLGRQVASSIAVFVRDIGAGMLEVGHNSLALVGLCVVATLVFAAGRADLREDVEQRALGWLQARQEAREPTPLVAELAEPHAVARATAVDLAQLPQSQAMVVKWLSRRYRVAPEPVGALVQEAWQVGVRTGLDPTLILAVMAIESSFNPFAQSPVGAQGLMQVMTRVHDDKYEHFGGTRAAFDPVTNLRVGALVLKECIARAGGLEAGLRHYVGAPGFNDDGGYVGKVLAEQLHLRRVADGKAVAPNAPLPSTTPASTAVPVPVEAPARPVAADRVAMLR